MLRALIISLGLGVFAALPAFAVELIMVEQKGCHYCREWNETIAPIYPKTTEGAFAPLRRADLFEGPPEGVTYARRVNFTPTFILIEDGAELARIEGYPGEDFFWGLLDMMLKANTTYTDTPD
ncbi:thioredoxin family protein [Lentibacter algarum]|uniref:thioredoxin family protein n=1 Tax=Lentibacter algarum TaxID=576131 RepID=UPI001C097FAF|nr:thioredoxin family protein [Lentibacter algarum]MBU2982803.1 thioredoxin family protein [Lentibacter algarum]